MNLKCSFLLLLGWAIIVCVVLVEHNWNYVSLGQETGSSRSASSANGSLAINMVIVPFLRYGASGDATLEREKDYKLCLERNLAHPQVQRVHILTTNATDALVRFQDFTGSSKLVISELKSVDRLRDIFVFISRNLLGRDVMLANADIYLGKGFDKINPTTMDQQNIMYSLSRLMAPEHDAMCGKTSEKYYFKDLCHKYIGSHDVFLFRLHKPLPQEFFRNVDFDFPSNGMEGRVNWSFMNVLKYCVLNPCTILEIFHYHCSDLRTNIYKPRLRKGEHVRVPPSDNMYCLP